MRLLVDKTTTNHIESYYYNDLCQLRVSFVVFHNCSCSVGAIFESRPVCSRESEFPPTFEVVRYRKSCGIQTKRDEYVKYKHTKC